jgi:hypothetical protein
MMRERREKTYRLWEPEHYLQDAQSPTAKLPEGDLVFFLRSIPASVGVKLLLCAV